MANKVCCDEVKVSASIEMNDRDYLNDILASEKDLSKCTTTALTEASNESIQKEFFDIFKTIDEMQVKAFELAWNNGWYKLEEAEKTKIKEKKKEMSKKFEELSK